jgi:AcrR family transcriptional regulator
MAIAIARRRFLDGQRLQIGEIAEELGVARTTVYRWFDGREGLYQETIWSLTEDALAQAEHGVTATGLDRIYEINRNYWQALASSAEYRRFLEQERRIALRVLFLIPGHIRGRFTARMEEMLREVSGELRPGVEPGILAHALARCGEAYVLGDDLLRSQPQPDATAKILRLVIDGARRHPQT